MATSPVPRLYLFARLPDGVGDVLAPSNDIAPALPGLRLIPTTRRHITLADLDATGASEAHVVAMIGWIMATMPPFAFPVRFDRIVTSARHRLLKASDPLLGALACQTHIAGMVRQYGLDLPRGVARAARHARLRRARPAGRARDRRNRLAGRRTRAGAQLAGTQLARGAGPVAAARTAAGGVNVPSARPPG